MPEIPDPPARPVCAACGPISWLWSPRRQAWIAFVGVPGQPRTLTVHGCSDADRLPTWRDDLPERDPERAHRGAALVRAALVGSDPEDEPTP